MTLDVRVDGVLRRGHKVSPAHFGKPDRCLIIIREDNILTDFKALTYV